ncbi:PqqD family peptide modification chaperone [Anderseniella sp. Alg231-50]|uniref:PqqD family peptide modification chaperone n=1 Tax=Anderseniella sp. Alg231-50 TaxID=1922226 RepID=UPI000D54FA33
MKLFYLNPVGLSYEDFGGEMVAVNFETGKYYGLSGSALAIWQLLIRPHSIDELVLELQKRYLPGEHDIRQMVEGFVKILDDEKLLLEIEANEQIAVANDAEMTPFEAPNLEVHSDLQELIMLDPVHDADPDHGWPVRRPES